VFILKFCNCANFKIQKTILFVQIGVRDYVRFLEAAVMDTLSSSFSIPSFTTCNTGVWVNHPDKGESKICAIGMYT